MFSLKEVKQALVLFIDLVHKSVKKHGFIDLVQQSMKKKTGFIDRATENVKLWKHLIKAGWYTRGLI